MEPIGKNIILMGGFNPQVFHPEFFFTHGIEVRVGSGVSHFVSCNETRTDFTIRNTRYIVDKNSFTLVDDIESPEKMADKLSQIFCKLTNTVSYAVNLIFFLHIDLKDFEQWTNLSDKLTRIDAWGPFGENIKGKQECQNQNSGLSSISMRVAENLDNCVLWKYVKIEPSMAINSGKGVYMQCDFQFRFEVQHPTLSIVNLAKTQASTRYEEACDIFRYFNELG